MNLWINAEHHFTGIGFLRGLANFAAGFDVIVYGFFEGRFNFFYGVSLVADNIANAQEMPKQTIIFQRKFRTAVIAFIFQNLIHGFTPISLKNARTYLTMYCLVSFCG